MADTPTDACCTHLRVSWRTESVGGGLTQGWWECDADCGKRFTPAIAILPTDAAQSEWPMWLDPEDDPLVLRNMAKVGYVLDEAGCDFLLNLAKNIELDFATHPKAELPADAAQPVKTVEAIRRLYKAMGVCNVPHELIEVDSWDIAAVLDRLAESALLKDAPDECARCGAAACRMAKLRMICEDCLPLAPLKYWKDGSIYPEDALRPDKASQGSTVSGGERPEQVEDAPGGVSKATAEKKAYRIAAKMCPTCRLRDNNYCRDPFHDARLEGAPRGPWESTEKLAEALCDAAMHRPSWGFLTSGEKQPWRKEAKRAQEVLNPSRHQRRD